QTTRSRRVGVLATEATVASGRYREALLAFDRGVEVVQESCPGLADRIQDGELWDEQTLAQVRAHCARLRAADVDTVILGCTHYPLIRPMLQRELGRGVTLVSAAEELAAEVAETLRRKRLANDEQRRGGYRFACTGDPDAFREVGRRFLQLPIGSVEQL